MAVDVESAGRVTAAVVCTVGAEQAEGKVAAAQQLAQKLLLEPVLRQEAGCLAIGHWTMAVPRVSMMFQQSTMPRVGWARGKERKRRGAAQEEGMTDEAREVVVEWNSNADVDDCGNVELEGEMQGRQMVD